MKLSVTMQRALSDAETHGGYLYRQPGGFWVARPHMSYKEQPWFSSLTVFALVKRGFMCFSTFKPTRGGASFAVEAKVNQNGSN